MATLIDRITERYEEDQGSGRIAVAAGDIPVSYEAIRPSWFDPILCAAHPGAHVVSIALDAADDGSANRRRIFLTYNDEGQRAGLPPSVFCKASHSLLNRLMLGINGSQHSEVTFYNQIAPSLDIPVPRAFFAANDADRYNYIVVLEDLAGRISFCTHETPIDRARAEDQIAVLATLHGRCYDRSNMSAALDLPTYPAFWDRLLVNGMEDYSNKGFLGAEDVIPPRLFARYAEIWPATMRAIDTHRAMPHTLMHGDCHLKNWYVGEAGEMGICDWQTLALGHWSRDLAYTMSTSLAVEDRRLWERDLIRLYLDRLQEKGGPRIGFDEAWICYRRQLASVLSYWTVTLTPSPGQPDMQPRDTTLEFIRRITHAIDDLDALDSLA